MKSNKIAFCNYPALFEKRQYPVVSTGLDNSNMLSECVLSIPMHAYLNTADVHQISSKLLDASTLV